MVPYIENTIIINLGSLGKSRNGQGFGYAIIDSKISDVLFYNVDFDKTKSYKKINYYNPNLDKLKLILERKKIKS